MTRSCYCQSLTISIQIFSVITIYDEVCSNRTISFFKVPLENFVEISDIFGNNFEINNDFVK